MRRGKRSVLSSVTILIALYSATSLLLMLCQIETPSSSSFHTPATATRQQLHNTESKSDDNKHNSNTRQQSKEQDNKYVFIGIKTSEHGAHGIRLPEIRKTWLRDALQSDKVDIKFFTHLNVNHTSDHDEPSSLMLTTKCNHQDLACKTGQVFAYYLQNSKANWFCSFDDDNYVLIDNLGKVLQAYEDGPTKDQDLYIGRALHPAGMFFPGINATVRFGTGGAGYCLTRSLVERGKDYFSALESFHLIDDVAVGYVSQHKLGVNITSDPLFHSHWERMIRTRMPQDEIAKQVSFSHENKGNYTFPYDDLPNTPLFPRKEDPMGFRSLWCHLHESDEMNSPECTPNKDRAAVAS